MKLLLVDDEKYTREGIIQDLKWDELGIDTVYQAKNGLDGLTIAEDAPIDILLTDVKMPKMNGIELAYKVQALYPDIKIVFMSGYSDKEFLKSAIELNAVRYIEKPLDMDELTAAIKKSIYLVDATNSLKSLIDTSMPLIHNNIAIELTKTKNDIQNIEALLKEQFPLYPLNSQYQVLMIKLIDFHVTIQELLPYDLFNTLLEQINAPTIWCYKDDQHILIHLAIEQPGFDYNQLKNSYELRSLIYDLIKEHATFGLIVGPLVDRMSDLSFSYQQTVIASKQLFLSPQLEIILSKKMTVTEKPYYEFDALLFKKFREFITTSQYDNAKMLLTQLTSELKDQNNLLEAQIKSYYYHFLMILQTTFVSLSDTYTVKDITHMINSANFFMMTSIDQLEDYLLTHLMVLADQFNSPSHYSDSCHSVLQHIHKSYDNTDLSLSDLADLSHLSISHMCVLFKKETGMTVNQYLTEYRIKCSLTLLLEEDIKLQFIANKVGFNDGNYFAKLFKKTIGLTPSQYREIKSNA